LIALATADLGNWRLEASTVTLGNALWGLEGWTTVFGKDNIGGGFGSDVLNKLEAKESGGGGSMPSMGMSTGEVLKPSAEATPSLARSNILFAPSNMQELVSDHNHQAAGVASAPTPVDIAKSNYHFDSFLCRACYCP
jgi:hypothetical protein